jgi:hypothetical protein
MATQILVSQPTSSENLVIYDTKTRLSPIVNNISTGGLFAVDATDHDPSHGFQR